MALEHAEPGQIVSVRPLENKLGAARTTTIVKTDRYELLRLVVHRGREIPAHQAPGDLIVQCLEGEVVFTALGRNSKLRQGDMLYLPARVPHSLLAKYDSSLLVTIVFSPKE